MPELASVPVSVLEVGFPLNVQLTDRNSKPTKPDCLFDFI